MPQPDLSSLSDALLRILRDCLAARLVLPGAPTRRLMRENCRQRTEKSVGSIRDN
jgi:hypothetical protein